jgi:hypothetical protein
MLECWAELFIVGIILLLFLIIICRVGIRIVASWWILVDDWLISGLLLLRLMS